MKNLIVRVGPIQALMIFGSVATCSILLQALYPTFFVWVALRFIVGISLAALYIVVESWILNFSTVKDRGVLLSLYMFCITASRAISQFILSYIDIYSFTPFLVSALFTSLSTIPVGLTVPQLLPSTPSLGTVRFRSIIHFSPLGTSVCLISGLILSTIYSFFPIFSISRGIPSQKLMAITIAGGVFFPWPSGKLSDLYDRRKCLILIVGMAFILCNFAFFYDNMPEWQLLILCFSLGGFAFTLYPLGVALMCDHISESNFTNAVSLLLICFGVGSVFGPLISSAAVELYGINAILIFFSLILAVAISVGLYSICKRPAGPSEEKSEFLQLRHITPVSLEIDPRGGDNESF